MMATMSASRSPAPNNALPPGAEEVETLLERLRRLELRCARECAAREEAESLLETKSLELFKLNQHLVALNNELEARVASRTADLTEAKEAAVKLLETDFLTKLTSRYGFHKKINTLIERKQARDTQFSLLLLDIDNFKAINDTYGHGIGDEMLSQIAARISLIARRSDCVARLGGDELAILFEDTTAEDAEEAASRILESFGASFNCHGLTMSCTASIGISSFPDHATSAQDLLRAADLALYKSKVEGRDRAIVFSNQLLDDQRLRHRNESDLKNSIEASAIEVWFQPIVDIRTGRNRAVEALARMQGQDGLYLPPSVFIPLAEETGLVHDLGRQVLRNSMNSARVWIDKGLIDLVAVNVSAHEFHAPFFADDVIEVLAEADIPGDRLVLEITESVMVAEMDRVKDVMNRLIAHGVKFALDDFGAGYTNLVYLRQLPISKVKLDLSLLASVAEDTKAQAILRHTVAMCKELGIRTVCEGIEEQAQLEFLQSIGCDFGQGYLLGRPMEVDQLSATLNKGPSRLITQN